MPVGGGDGLGFDLVLLARQRSQRRGLDVCAGRAGPVPVAPGSLASVPGGVVVAVHLTLLRPDGSPEFRTACGNIGPQRRLGCPEDQAFGLPPRPTARAFHCGWGGYGPRGDA